MVSPINDKVKSSTKYEYPSFNDIVWAVAVRDIIGYNKSYDKLMGNEGFLNALRKKPSDLTPEKIQDNLLRFLNDWGCRITKNKFSIVSKEIKDFLKDNEELFDSLSSEKIQNYDFDNSKNQLYNLIKELDDVPEIGPTGVSKTLHVINPALFVMWDKDIAEIVSERHSIKQYLHFLKEMQKSAIEVEKTFNHAGKPETYINKKFKLNPKCSLTKFIDEYNWGKYRKEWKVPPKWGAKLLSKMWGY